ncbi:vWA domain-containing protein [Paraliomyxa miuraensis]|uniref:vWA domain-containing protein n=1 Tax=Paraliomyxa miuraensis TaxID=376150 RepID=UPI00224CD5EA|nr:VWA domain-containing protein [Paraliomyxa miuraensis]MCX4244282.1 VWA domain-containing protein [Paraliomyxa miuraensis]
MTKSFRSIPTLLALAVSTGACLAGESLDAGYTGDGYFPEDEGEGDGAAEDGGDEPGPDQPPAPIPDDQEVAPDEPMACNTADDVTLYLSPDDSNSMSSPVQARETVLEGFSSLSAVAIRPWEFMNYYAFDYPAADPGEVRIFPSLIAGQERGAYTLQIAVSSERVIQQTRAPLNITLVLDTSGSMSGHAMDMEIATCRAIASSLKEGDVISMVTWDTSNQEVLAGRVVDGPNDPVLLAAIDTLSAGGGTDLNGGLTAGYTLAEQWYDKSRINRIVLVSDGGANAGVTDIELIGQNAAGNDGDGIYMVGVGVGVAGTYNDDLMDTVTDAGKGASVFINDVDEAQKVFGEQFISTLDVAVRNVSVKLDMPPGFEVVRFSGEEISTDPTEVEPQHLAPNDTMVFHQDIRTCAPHLVGDDTSFEIAVRYQDGTTFASHELRTRVTFGELLGQTDPLLHKGAAVFAYAEALKELKEGSVAGIERAMDALAQAEALNPEDEDLAEIRMVLEAL